MKDNVQLLQEINDLKKRSHYLKQQEKEMKYEIEAVTYQIKNRGEYQGDTELQHLE